MVRKLVLAFTGLARAVSVCLEEVSAQILIIYWAGNHTLRTRARLCDVSLIGFGAGRTIA